MDSPDLMDLPDPTDSQDLMDKSDSSAHLPRKFLKIIACEAIVKYPVHWAEMATVCKKWAQYVSTYKNANINKELIESHKRRLIIPNQWLCGKIYTQSMTEHEIIECFENPFFCPNFTYRNKWNTTGLTYLDLLISYDKPTALEKVLSLGATGRVSREPDFNTYERVAAKRQNHILPLLKASNPNLNETYLLDYAAKFLWPYGITYLTNNNCDINKTNENGMTPLHAMLHYNKDFAIFKYAAFHNTDDFRIKCREIYDTVELLLNRGANQNTPVVLKKEPTIEWSDKYISTPEVEACLYENQEIRATLLNLLRK